MPLGGEFGVDSLEAIVRGNRLPGAIWTATSSGSVEDSGLPIVPFAAFPPNLFVAPPGDVSRGQITVPGWMPLRREFGRACVEAIIFAGESPRTIRTSIALRAV